MSIILNRFADWFQRFSRKKKRDEYIGLDNINEKTAHHKPVGIFQLVSILRKTYSTMNLLYYIQVSICYSVRFNFNVYFYNNVVWSK